MSAIVRSGGVAGLRNFAVVRGEHFNPDADRRQAGNGADVVPYGSGSGRVVSGNLLVQAVCG